MSLAQSFLDQLRADGVVRHVEARLVPLTGGVSSEIYLVEDDDDRFVVKRALAKLKVAAEWFADVGRNAHEREYIRYVSRFLPAAVPALRESPEGRDYFAMEYLGDGFQNWKQLLLKGEAKEVHAAQAGELLATIHRQSAGDAEAARLFDTTDSFFQLRIEPYLLATGAKHPELRSLFEAEAKRLAATRECLVHGDFSPKNILIGEGAQCGAGFPACGSMQLQRMVLLDCEVAWYGDPAFDLAFGLNHFFLKAVLHAPEQRGFRSMIHAFWTTYQTTRPTPDLDARVAHLLLLLMLARVDGKSPVEYLDAPRQELVRAFVREQFPLSQRSVSDVADEWFERLSQLPS